MRTRIRGGWVVGYDEFQGNHLLYRDGVVEIEDDRIIAVGKSPSGEVDQEIDATGKLVSPGFINTHVHTGIESMAAQQDLDGFDGGPLLGARRSLFNGDLPCFLSHEDIRTHMMFGLAHMLKTGATTIIDVIGSSSPWWTGNTPDDVHAFVNVAGELGARVYSTPGYRTHQAYVATDGQRSYVERESLGFEHLERAVRFIEDHHGSHNGRIMGMLFPHAVDNTSPSVLRATREMANKLRVGIQIHAAQSVHEINLLRERHNCSPIELLQETGVLGEDVLLGHCIFLNDHSWINQPGRDLEIIARTSTAVAHSPLKFVYQGFIMESFQRYVDAGITMTIGTDVSPSDILLEMRVAAIGGKLVERDGEKVRTADLYNAATLGGAKALGRDDLGRLSPGAKADIVIVDLGSVDHGHIFDPIRALVHYCTTRDINTVMVDGRVLVQNHELVDIDEEKLMADALPVYKQLQHALADRNWNTPSQEELFPICLPIAD